MYGAILGDIIGSPYEFDMGDKTKDFPLFGEGCDYTDDTVMTVAVAKVLLESGELSDEERIMASFARELRRFGRAYPGRGYGGRFGLWLDDEDMGPYNSFGNGSAMRVSPAGWLYDDMDSVLKAARLSAAPTHDHPEGVKGAQSVAAAILLARKGKSKEEIKAFIEERFGYDLSRTCGEIRPHYRMDETCQGSVPEAITAFLEGESFEDVIRTAVSLGGDTDTVACIAGSMAEAYYGVPEELVNKCREYLPEEFLDILDRVYGTVA